MAPIEIRNNVWDPAAPPAQLAAPEAGKKNYILVQLRNAMDNDTLAALTRAKVTIIKRMQGNTWLCSIAAPPLPTAITVPQLAVAVVYDKFFKVHASLKAGNAPASADRVIGVSLHEDAKGSTDAVSQFARGLAGVTVLDAAYGTIRLRTSDVGNLDRIAAQSAVQAVEVIPPMGATNLRTRITIGRDAMNANANLIAMMGANGLTGLGQIVGVADTGLNMTHPSFAAAPGAATVVFSQFYPYPPPPPAVAPAMDDIKGHGTHVASTLAGRPTDGNIEPTSSPGMAPAASLAIQRLNFATGFNFVQVFQDAYNAGARVHNDSWGPVFGPGPAIPNQPAYTVTDAEQVDLFIFQNPEFSIIFSAGNNGGRQTDMGNQQIGGPPAAKNCITVGATPSSRNVLPVPGMLGGYQAGALGAGAPLPHTDVCNFSSRGPTREGRFKPDIVAPGQNILGAHASNMPADITADWNTQHGAALVGNLFGFCSGTSMAAPAVSGCCALLREGLSAVGVPNPTAALIKAILLNFAAPLPAPAPAPGAPIGAPPPQMAPRTRQGFGEVDLRRVPELLRNVQQGATGAGPPTNPFAAALPNTTCGVWMSTFTPVVLPTGATPQPQFRTITRGTAPGNTLRVTLVYIDPPGSALQSKLKLSVQYTPTVPAGAGQQTVVDTVNGPLTTTGAPNPCHSNVQKIAVPNVGLLAHVLVEQNPQVVVQTHFAVVWDFVPNATPAPLIPPPM